tara:strand:- start:4560 stop:4814 length:255 start_codon:yes stop_codon:yes gene_type:complete
MANSTIINICNNLPQTTNLYPQAVELLRFNWWVLAIVFGLMMLGLIIGGLVTKNFFNPTFWGIFGIFLLFVFIAIFSYLFLMVV